MTRESSKERQKRFMERRRAAGMKRFSVWIYPGDEDRLKAYAARLNRKREREMGNPGGLRQHMIDKHWKPKQP